MGHRRLRLLWRFLVFLFLALQILSAADFDPYRVLGVSRTANQADIKKAYKKLAREWHPDKNKNPGAEDKFIQVSKAYEILSNEEKRTNYDRFGDVGDNQGYSQQQQHHHFRHFHDSFYFDESFFHFPFNSERRDSTDEKYLLQFSHYINEVVPDSFRKPYLIKITSDWCFSCIHIEPVWKEVVQELEGLGVGIGVVHAGYERRLAHHLGAHSTPSILGVINGKISFFHNAVLRENLRHFVESLLPGNLVDKITDKNYIRFLSNWQQENKPHVLLFDQMPPVPLIYKLTAFAYKDYLSFGYVDLGQRETEQMSSQYNINMYAPTMLVFKEHIHKPADVVQARGMKKQVIDDFISTNKFLLAARLTNQKIFQELCPVRKSHRQRKYCVVLLTGEGEPFKKTYDSFLAFASANTKDTVRFVHAFKERQQELAISLLGEDIKPGESSVAILERRNSAGRIVHRTLASAWSGSEENKFALLDFLDRLRKDPSILSSETILTDLNDELAPVFFLRWVYIAVDYWSDVWESVLHNNWREMMPLLSLIFSALFILFGTVIVQAFSDSSDDRDSVPSDKEEPSDKEKSSETNFTKENTRVPKKGFVEVTELTDVNYMSNLVRLRPGHMNVVLILSSSTKASLLQRFAQEVYTFTGSSSLHFSFLNLDKHREWLEYLLEFAQDAATIAYQYDEHFLERDYTGYVLALNGHKKYFCLFKAQSTLEDEKLSDEGEVCSPSGDSLRKISLGSGAGHIKKKLNKLSLWMERLLEGSLQRFYIPSWPLLD
ncbi:dnaJ homolog subfamily C member 16 [Bufo bufo]|uniref:dnaJ homolog subfamily C member 16 n=1 Tax=Bufo bufo TaxID=8384 RepID=UPI001ABDB017|nr:dnaJ homolog subfamily C member 16 [Bufo bufo]XP_040278550.1 dnaJ homolog subfamily C member 16 [Bufo bufo]XP_040278554.1 dnaJ homolog subfamily C member 16 [Bufo bufo]